MECRQSNDLEKENLDLKKYLNILIKRKMLIVAVFSAVVIFSISIGFISPKVYESSFVIELGRIEKILINKGETRDKVLNKNFLLSILKDLKLCMDVDILKKSIFFNDTNSENLIEVVLRCSNPQVCLKLGDVISSRFVDEGKKIYQDGISVYRGRLAELDKSINILNQNIKRSQDLIETLLLDKDIPSTDLVLKGILLQNTLLGYENNVIALENQKNELMFFLSKSRDFKIFESPVMPKHPLGVGKKHKVLIGAVAGLVFGVLLAFFLEYWQQKENSIKK